MFVHFVGGVLCCKKWSKNGVWCCDMNMPVGFLERMNRLAAVERNANWRTVTVFYWGPWSMNKRNQ